MRDLLAVGCRILSDQEHDHFHLGHVSARVAAGADRFWVKAGGIGLGEVGPASFVLLDLDGNRLAGDGSLHHEMPIHGEIYRRRPDVGAIVHTHPFYSAALAATAADFRVVSQDSLPFAPRPAHYDSALLIVTPEQGREVAQTLGDGCLVLLRNHGIVAAGANIEEAVYLAVAFERSVRLQHVAAGLGEVREIAPDEIADMTAGFAASQADRSRMVFAYLRRRLRDAGD